MSLPEESLESFRDQAACLQPHNCPETLAQTPALLFFPCGGSDVLTLRSLCTKRASNRLSSRKTRKPLEDEILTQGDPSSTVRRSGQPSLEPGYLYTLSQELRGKETRSGLRDGLELVSEMFSFSPGPPLCGIYRIQEETQRSG